MYPFHMPGHKRAEGIKLSFPDPFSVDITEIDGFDNLHHPEGILKDSMKWASSLYGSDRTWYLVNGSTCGLLSAISAAVSHGGKILVSRNCHKAVYHGIYLNHLEAVYVYPQKMDLERTVLYLLPAYVPAYERDTYPISGTFLNVQ